MLAVSEARQWTCVIGRGKDSQLTHIPKRPRCALQQTIRPASASKSWGNRCSRISFLILLRCVETEGPLPQRTIMPVSTKAVVVHAAGQPWSYEEVELADPSSGQLHVSIVSVVSTTGFLLRHASLMLCAGSLPYGCQNWRWIISNSAPVGSWARGNRIRDGNRSRYNRLRHRRCSRTELCKLWNMPLLHSKHVTILSAITAAELCGASQGWQVSGQNKRREADQSPLLWPVVTFSGRIGRCFLRCQGDGQR